MPKACWIVFASCVMLGQPAADPPAFDVASVKPANPNGGAIWLGLFPGGRLRVTNYTLKGLIHEAL